jgi:hypothetical protein
MELMKTFQRVYITKVITDDLDTQNPYLAGQKCKWSAQYDAVDKNEENIKDSDLKIDGEWHRKIHDKCVVIVNATKKVHRILENDNDIRRIDNLGENEFNNEVVRINHKLKIKRNV